MPAPAAETDTADAEEEPEAVEEEDAGRRKLEGDDDEDAHPNLMAPVDFVVKGRTLLKDGLEVEAGECDNCIYFADDVIFDDNVKFVDDVTPYEFMKIRILNGGHASLCYPSALLGLKYVHDAMEHPTIAAFLNTLQRKEVIPSVPPVPDTDLGDYWELIQARFANPVILDTIDRICFDGANRQPKFIIPPVSDNLRDGRSVEGLALVSAMWCRYCQGKAESGKEFAPNDPIWDQLHETALQAAEDPTIWLNMKSIYGAAGEDPRFVESFTQALRSITENGVEQTMKNYVANNPLEEA